MAHRGGNAKRVMRRYWIGVRLSLAPIRRRGGSNPSDIFLGQLTRTQTRFVETFDQRLSRGKEILCIKSGRDRAQQTRVAVGTRSRIVHLFILESNGTLEPCYSVDLDKTVPVSLGFADNTDIIVFGLYDGKMYVPSTQSRKLC